MKFRITKEFGFEAAQTLPKVPKDHKCRRMHGHSFKLEVTIEGPMNKDAGWVYEHAQISEAVRPIITKLDHSYLNEVEGLENPTIENMCVWFWNKLEPQLPGLFEILIHETPTARCSFRGFGGEKSKVES